MRCIIPLLLVCLFIAPSYAAEKYADTYDRVTKTNTIRCGYFVWAPYFIKDSNTGKLSGANYEIMESLATSMGWKIDWVMEIGPGDIVPALETGKIDAYCLGVWQTPARAKTLTFIGALGYAGIYPYVRQDETRIESVDDIDRADITISTMEGEGASTLARQLYKKAKFFELPQTASYADLYLNVATKKADLVLSDVESVRTFLKNNPGTLKRATKQPIGTFPFSFVVQKGQERFANSLTQAQHIMLSTGELERIYKNYGMLTEGIYLPAKPY
jgi:ABC-type amino acid transport substrate-binding protein